MNRRLLLSRCLMVLLAACGAPADDPGLTTASGLPGTREAISLLGEELARPTLPDAFRDRQERLLRQARQALDASPDNPDALIWVGRRTAYLGRYGEAIEIYSDGIDAHPDYAPFYRHRGHRYISTRQLDAAVRDLTRAAELVRGQPDRIEPDGLPNERGIPTSTLQSNIYYHLGLALYLQGDFEGARRAYERCLEVSNTEDNIVATAHWLYMSLRRLGLEDEATALLETVSSNMDIIENHDYLRLLLMYKGEIGVEDLWQELAASGDSLGSATLGYGVGNWLCCVAADDRADGPLDARDRAFELFSRIHAGEQWAAFGYIAAEAELARLSAYEREVYAWRASRFDSLLQVDGWLSLAGLFWLDEGEFSFGTDPSADFVFAPAAGAESPPPALFGIISVEGGGAGQEVFVQPAPGVEITIGGQPVDERTELASDATATPTYLEVTPYRFYLIERSERPFLRVLDLSRFARIEKPRIPYFPIDESWRIEARFEPYDPPRTIPVPTILDTTNQSPSPGALVFERDGAEHRLDAIDAGDELFVIFADRTTGDSTYGGGRYIYTERANDDGLVIFDFNRAYNPPCVFTVHATCPLPPRQNRLELEVDAGEKMVRGYLDHH